MNGSHITERVAVLRRLMAARGWAAVVVPTGDPHGNEYPLDRWKLREWLTGFTGSAGTAVVTATDAALWTDSRYWLAAEEALSGTPFSLMREGATGTPTPARWLQELHVVGEVAVPYEAIARADCRRLSEQLGDGLALCPLPEADVDALWPDRPALPDAPFEVQPDELAGQTAAAKLEQLRADDRAFGPGPTVRLVGNGADIAWLLNLRGNDIPYNPVVTAWLLVEDGGGTLFADARKVTPAVAARLEALGIGVRPYDAWPEALRASPASECKLLVDPSVPQAVVDAAAGSGATLDIVPSGVEHERAVKNEAEAEGFRRAMLRDGAALVRFRRRLDDAMAGGGRLTEMDVDRLLTAERAREEGFRGLSFATIAAYGPHGAIVHYEATPDTDAPLLPRGFLLLDSGAQYIDGTTDVTRTIPLGPLTDEERRVYMLVLKGHIALSRCRFPEGTTGFQLDLAARYAMWQEGYDFGHGTGHGVGSHLCVHEGPHQIRKDVRPCTLLPLAAGMTVTDEPGVYLAGRFGVRIENTLLVRRDEAHPGFLCFEPLTLCPFDLDPVDLALLTAPERAWLNAYHDRVREALGPRLDDEADRRWLLHATRHV